MNTAITNLCTGWNVRNNGVPITVRSGVWSLGENICNINSQVDRDIGENRHYVKRDQNIIRTQDLRSHEGRKLSGVLNM